MQVWRAWRGAGAGAAVVRAARVVRISAVGIVEKSIFEIEPTVN